MAPKTNPSAAAPRKRTVRKSGDGYNPVETRKALLDSALTLFEQRGYPVTSVEDIVAGAGLTKGAFYYHFSSKDEVLQILHDTYVDNALAVCRTILAEHDDPREQVRQIVRASVLDLSEFRSHIIVYMRDSRFLTGDRERLVLAKRASIDRILQGAIQRGIDSGVFREDLSARLSGFGIVGMCAWVIQWWRPGSRATLEQIADEYEAFALRALDAAG